MYTPQSSVILHFALSSICVSVSAQKRFPAERISMLNIGLATKLNQHVPAVSAITFLSSHIADYTFTLVNIIS